MNSRKNNIQDENKKHKLSSPLKYIGMMGACCLLPILIAGLIPLLQLNNLGGTRLLSVISPFICPIIMGIMMISMLKGKKGRNCCSHHPKEESNDSQPD